MGFLPQAPIGEALADYLDIHSDISWTKQLELGVDAFWNGRRAIGNVHSAVNPSKYWTTSTVTVDDGQFLSPVGYDHFAVYSKQLFKYPHFSFYSKLPALVNNGQEVFFGLENDSGWGNGAALFQYYRSAGTNHLAVGAGAAFAGAGVYQDIDNAIPSNSTTTRHVYEVIVTKRGAEFYIDRVLVAYAPNAAELNFTNITHPRVAYLKPNMVFTPKMQAIIECAGRKVALSIPVNSYGIRVTDADPYPPRLYRLYSSGTDTLLAGLSVNPDVTSHPFPIYGCKNKTIHFQADEAGTLEIHLLTETNNWRTYDSVAIAANTLESYTIASEGVLARIKFTPTAPPANIDDAECVIR